MINKLKTIKARYEELTNNLSSPDAMNDHAKWLEMTKEHSQLADIVAAFTQYEKNQEELDACKEMLTEADPQMRELIVEELYALEQEAQELTEQLKILLLPKDPNDDRNVIIEIRAGTGGDEAALFGADL
ncbi:MAG: PCRF domain-containing protein, partial [Clostridia bacterium]|nr:PCRF domain-containing protein [Clostridia bacterium]